jgi:hypothetical protein
VNGDGNKDLDSDIGKIEEEMNLSSTAELARIQRVQSVGLGAQPS